MATANPTQQVPKAVKRKLNGLRSKLTSWMVVHGISRWLMIVLGILAVDMLLDRVFKMDFAQRLVMLVVMVAAVAVYFVWKVVKPLLLRPNDEALIYEIENNNPKLNESLISGYQLAGEKDLEARGFSQELAQATIERGLATAGEIDFGKSLNQTENSKNWLMLLGGIAVSALLAFGVTQTEFLGTWFNRNIMLSDDQWPQATYLEIAGAENGRLVLPRGNDHRQLVLVTKESTESQVDVSLEIENPGGRTIHPMKKTGKLDGREHMFMFHNVSSAFRFRASGGDDVTEWVDVELVEPPNIIELKLQSLLPEYTGIKSMPLSGNGPHSVLVGSKLRVGITTNKPLNEAAIKLEDDLYTMNPTDVENTFDLVIPGQKDQVLRGGEYQFELTDESGLKSTRTSKFKVTIKEDEDPKVRASLLGISGLVSARANLPTAYQSADEYGLTKLSFDMNWKTSVEEEKPGHRELVFSELGVGEDGLPIRSIKDAALLDLLPMNLKPGTSFRFSVKALDNQPTPGVGRSQEFLLRVVSDEELRADLLRREIEQRKAFDQAYQAQMELATNLQALAVRRMEPGTAKEEFDSKREAALIGQVRSQKGVGTALDRIANRFEEFLVEVHNNRLHEAENELAPEQRLETRFDEKIIKPIRSLDRELVSMATRHMDNCRLSVRDPEKLAAAADQAARVHQQVLDEMKKILNAMNDSEDYQQIINNLLQLKDESKRQGEDIKERLKPKNIFDEDKSDIFDNN